MVITITMQNIRLRNGIYEFRMAVPKDCQESVGRIEISESLKTSNPKEAAPLADALTTDWKKKFKSIRSATSPVSPIIKSKTDNTVIDFKKKFNAHIGNHLADYLECRTEEKLVEASEWLMDCMATIKLNDGSSIDLSDELGITYPLPAQKSPGMTRKLNKAVVDALCCIRKAIDGEAGWLISEKVEEVVLDTIPQATEPATLPVNSNMQSARPIKASSSPGTGSQ